MQKTQSTNNLNQQSTNKTLQNLTYQTKGATPTIKTLAVSILMTTIMSIGMAQTASAYDLSVQDGGGTTKEFAQLDGGGTTKE